MYIDIRNPFPCDMRQYFDYSRIRVHERVSEKRPEITADKIEQSFRSVVKVQHRLDTPHYVAVTNLSTSVQYEIIFYLTRDKSRDLVINVFHAMKVQANIAKELDLVKEGGRNGKARNSRRK